MTDITITDRAKVDALQAALLHMPQYQPKTNHYFANGMYLRTVWSPAGSVIVGKTHKTEHFYAVLSGVVQVTTGNDVVELNARRDGPQILTCPVGTKRAVYVVEDAWRMNVHINVENIRDIEILESELVEHDPCSPFLPGNIRKALT